MSNHQPSSQFKNNSTYPSDSSTSKSNNSTSSNLNQELQLFKTRFEASTSTLIVFDPSQASLDQVALATALYLTFQKRIQSRASLQSQSQPNNSQSTVSLLALSDLLVEHSSLVGIEQAQTELPTQGLVIAIDNSDSIVGNISCDADDQNQQLKIYIKSQTDKTVIQPGKISFQPLTADFDLIIGIGLSSQSQFALLQDQGINNLNPQNTLFIQSENFSHQVYSFDPLQANLTSSYSEFLAVLLRHWTWAIDSDIATNLLVGIDSATQNFALPNLSPSAFEAAGWLLRQGGVRYLPSLVNQQQKQPTLPEAIPQFSGDYESLVKGMDVRQSHQSHQPDQSRQPHHQTESVQSQSLDQNKNLEETSTAPLFNSSPKRQFHKARRRSNNRRRRENSDSSISRETTAQSN